MTQMKSWPERKIDFKGVVIMNSSEFQISGIDLLKKPIIALLFFLSNNQMKDYINSKMFFFKTRL